MIVPPESRTDKGADASTDRDLVDEPPPYTPQSPTSTSAEPPTPSKRVNYLHVTETNSAIKGVWAVDPTMRIPAALMPSIPGGQTPYNLLLRSYNGSISAKLLLSSQTPSKSLLFAESHNGKVMLVITARQNQRFNLSATSQNGAVVVYIPRDFQGPVAFRNGNGKTTFSEAIKPHLTPFGRDRDTGKVFIGDWETSGYGDETADHNAWPGDELDLVSHNGNIKVYYSDEPIKPSTSELFWKDVMTYGPIGGVVQTVKRNINRAMTNATRDEHPGYTTSYYPDKKDKTSSTDQTSSTVKPPSSDKIPPFGDFKS